MRPKYDDFYRRLGERFVATADGDTGGGDAWLLTTCERLPAAEDVADGFRMVFRCGRNGRQATYNLRAADGFEQAVFAVPGGSDWMHVTVF